jgi:uncharacterized protein
MTASGKFVWFEYLTPDAKKAQGFYGELFGWGTQPVPMPQGNYEMIAVGGKTIGGYLATPPGAPSHGHWLSHLLVTDATATANKVKSLGGSIKKETMKVGDFGHMAIVADPKGAVFALWQPAKVEESPKVETGHFCWNELFSADPDASVAFYKAIGGFEAKAMPMPEGVYNVLESGGEPRAGIGAQMMPGQPHAWMPYVSVASADASADKAKKLGASILVPPTDIPNVGRFAIFTDPQGGTLGLLQPVR